MKKLRHSLARAGLGVLFLSHSLYTDAAELSAPGAGVVAPSVGEVVAVCPLAAAVLNAHVRQVEALVTTREPDGRLVASTNTAVVLSTGQHYLDSEGQWRESRPEIAAVADGFVAVQWLTRGAFYNWHPTLQNQ